MICNNITHIIRECSHLPEVNEEDLLKIIGSLKTKNSTGIDGISLLVTKKSAICIIKQPLLCYSRSIRNSCSLVSVVIRDANLCREK